MRFETDLEKPNRDHIQRMGEPEPYRSLRRQVERLEAEQERRCKEFFYDREAERLRRKIRELGEEPCA